MSIVDTVQQALVDLLGANARDESWLRRNYPSAAQALEAARAQSQAGDIPTIKVVRGQLIDKLGAKRDAILAEFDAAGKKLDDADEARTNFTAALSKWYADMSKGIKAGTFAVNARYATVERKDGGPEVPEQPNGARTEADVNQARQRLAKDRAAAVAEIEAQLLLLSIGSDDAIEVVGASVQALLNTPVPTVREY